MVLCAGTPAVAVAVAGDVSAAEMRARAVGVEAFRAFQRRQEELRRRRSARPPHVPRATVMASHSRHQNWAGSDKAMKAGSGRPLQ